MFRQLSAHKHKNINRVIISKGEDYFKISDKILIALIDHILSS